VLAVQHERRGSSWLHSCRSVAAEEGDQRLDRWLKRRFPQLNQAMVERLCRKGELRVDGGRVKAATRLEAGQSVRIPPLPAAPAPRPEATAAPAPASADVAMIQAAVIWKDQHVIALNKPPGLPSQGGSGQGARHVDGLTEALMFGYKERPVLVHRLDKDTSGIMLLARTPRVARRLGEAFRARDHAQDLLGHHRRCARAGKGHHPLWASQGRRAERRENALHPPRSRWPPPRARKMPSPITR
jgi:23S rRNA-/tRNA-specific pseudouridylate synthase